MVKWFKVWLQRKQKQRLDEARKHQERLDYLFKHPFVPATKDKPAHTARIDASALTTAEIDNESFEHYMGSMREKHYPKFKSEGRNGSD